MQQFADYRPSRAVLDKLKNVTLVAVVGPSGVGKTTLMEAAAAVNPQLQFVIATVSRAPRPEERDGVDYHFRTKAEMLEHIKRLEYVNVAPSLTGDLYTTDPKSFPQNGIGMMAIWADAMPYFRSLPFRAMRTIFVTPPSYEIWQQRIGTHKFTADQLQKRLAEARRSFEFALHDPEVTVVVNDALAKAVASFSELALGRAKAASQAQARQLVADILQKLPIG